MEFLSSLTSFYGFYICFTWGSKTLIFFLIFLLTLSSIFQHFINTLVFLEKMQEKYCHYVLWLDRCFAFLSSCVRYKTLDDKTDFFLNTKTILSFLLLISLDGGFWNDKYYDLVHSIWHIFAFSLLDKKYK